MMLIGSRALAHWCPEFKLKPDADWDIVMHEEDRYIFNDLPRIDYHWTSHLNNKDILELFATGKFVMVGTQKVEVCHPVGLAEIKRSHLWRDYFFDKHITMYHKYLARYADELTPYSRFLKERTKLTKQAYPQGAPSLLKSNEDFFDDAVEKKYDHDWLHELAAYYDKPLYTKLKRDDSLAWCEADLWKELSHEDKLRCVAEEVYVISTERFMVRTAWEHHPKGAYLKALQKVCTTLTSGWFRDFAIDHYPEILTLYDLNKLQTIKEKIHA